MIMAVAERAFVLWNLCVFLILMSANASSFHRDSGSNSRIEEAKRQCSSVLSAAVELKDADEKVGSMVSDLSFANGEWRQDTGNHPIIPYIRSEIYGGEFANGTRKPVNLASFWITDIDHVYGSKKSVSVNGLLVVGFTTYISRENIYQQPPFFKVDPSGTLLTIKFQGFYSESNRNGGEKIICLLGNSEFPSRAAKSSDPWKWGKELRAPSNQPPLIRDDQILLVLRYPSAFSLTSRVIRGEMKSLSKESSLKYFDDVHIASQFENMDKYIFGSEKLISEACDPYPYKDSLIDGSIDLYKGPLFCDNLNQISPGWGSFKFLANWKCNGTNKYCSQLGPFAYSEMLKAENGTFQGFEIYIQNLKCEKAIISGESNAAKVSAVFRVSTTNDPPFDRSALNNMTAVAEGIWKPSNGQLCMIACHGSEGSNCDARICLYIPVTFSITQRSTLIGTISSIESSDPGFFPLQFHKLAEHFAYGSSFMSNQTHYSYSKLKEAGVILDKGEDFNFRTVIKKPLLKFPKLEDQNKYEISLSNLAEDLTIQRRAFPTEGNVKFRAFLNLEIFSIGPLLRRYSDYSDVSFGRVEDPYQTKAEYTRKQLLTNISGFITVSMHENESFFSVEGLYDPYRGKMYLVGCRQVRASWEILHDSMDLEEGHDCLVDIVVSYPPTTSRWLVSPSAKISILSKRNDDDPLHFKAIKLQTLPIRYRKQREDILSTRSVEAILQLITLSFAVGCILSQIFYIKTHPNLAPYISLAMLGVQALGFSLPLITDAKALFQKAPPSQPYTMYDEISVAQPNQLVQINDYTVKVLVLISFLLTVRLCQKVWKSRSRILSTSAQDSHPPSDKGVAFITCIVHTIGFAAVLLYSTNQSHPATTWKSELEEYIGLVQDLFLLPQIIGNCIWQIGTGKPLRKLYFIGITVVRLLPHVYDYIREPVPNMDLPWVNQFADTSMDFYTKFGDIIISIVALILAVTIYIQQTWRTKLWRRKPRYQRLPFQPIETELACDNKAVQD